ncbi:MAG: hypothetical protein SF069_04155 [Phycisphaerae bacterium]|nr:hypothetical protein [Phycisphaerae bacterium]
MMVGEQHRRHRPRVGKAVIILGAAIVAALTAKVCGAPPEAASCSATKTTKHQVDLPINLKSTGGRPILIEWPSGVLVVNYEPGRERVLGSLTVVGEADVAANAVGACDSVRFEVVQPTRPGGAVRLLVKSPRNQRGCRVQLTGQIVLPSGTPLTIEAKHGTVRVFASDAPLEIRSENADVTVQDAVRRVKIRTRNGDVKLVAPADEVSIENDHGDVFVELTNSNSVVGKIDVKCKAGMIDAMLSPEISATIDPSTMRGRVLRFERESPARWTAGVIDPWADPLKLGAGERPVSLNSQCGNVSLRVDQPATAVASQPAEGD